MRLYNDKKYANLLKAKIVHHDVLGELKYKEYDINTECKFDKNQCVNMLNWGTYSQKNFNKNAVWFNKSPNYLKAKIILALLEIRNYPKISYPSI